MEQKNITGFEKEYEIKWHPDIKGVQIIEGKNNFPISWLNKQGYCEYQLYLEYMKGIETARTAEMKHGSDVHEQLEKAFMKDATPATFEEVVEMSKREATITRECEVISPRYGIRGFIDEIQMTPDEIVIIDDKPGRTPYPSTINQVRAYCLAFKDMTDDSRKIRGALRERGTDNVFWAEAFTPEVESQIRFTIDRVQGLLDGTKPFIPTKNPRKCRSCRFKSYCDHYKEL